MWNLPRPGIEPMTPALAGRFLTTGPPGKSLIVVLICMSLIKLVMLNIFSRINRDMSDHLYVFFGEMYI